MSGDRVVRDIALTEVSSNPLVEEKYPNEFQTAYFAHIDDNVLSRAVMNKTAFTFDLSFLHPHHRQGEAEPEGHHSTN